MGQQFTEMNEFDDLAAEFEAQLAQDAQAKQQAQKEQAAPAQSNGWAARSQGQPAKSNDDWKKQPAYIDKETVAASKTNPYVKDAMDKMLEVAIEMGESVREAGLTPQNKTKEGKTYDAKFVVKVEPAVRWNNETKQEEPFLKKDGSQMYAPRIEMKSAGATLTIYAKERMDEKPQITSAKLSRFDRYHNKPVVEVNEKIAEDKYAGALGKVAVHLAQQGFIQGKDEAQRSNDNPLIALSVELNKGFSDKIVVDVKAQDESGKYVPTGEMKEVKDSYARYINDEYGEKVQIRSHTEPSVVVDIFPDKNGDLSAKVTNFDFKDDNGRFAAVYINKPEDVKEFIQNPEVQQATLQAKFGGEQQNEKKSPTVERD
jgi:hypothetical protein